jgi:A/G-specific adenine glycosylase
MKIHIAIRKWYGAHGRKHLPWRNTEDPYPIYISEIMLQQTQVATVLARYYFPFLKKFPTLNKLANAPEMEVLKAWEGLGYYQRARNLHKTAKLSTPKLPDTLEELIALPGIGQNTAHAILAFAHHQPVPVLEANVKRVIARYYAAPQASWELAEQLLDRKQPFIYNQAMMDIGATICTPKNPKCGECPLRSGCKGKQNPTLYPTKNKKQKPPTRHRYITIYVKENKVALAHDKRGQMLAGLYGFPQMETKPAGKNISTVTHQYSHFTLQADIVLSTAKPKELSIYNLTDIAKLPLSTLDKKVLKILIDHKVVTRQNRVK